MELVHVNGKPEMQGPYPSAKKLPMDKDPVFLAMLRKEIIDDHNRKIRAKNQR